ncbi:GNAT family N-acetyltransferase [Luteipulveratus halotolerans]|uniref:N-acetyltransferase domain-containing protein n=1 Tax=Luteipulveratus halotolerans TaxID=1631356 RepID=A0A0L6CK13_9MICO|nr:GNAT family N-acetyltransferase [Luteipulveratus halotolerans]KNX38151.1 hypothetical protein VV01_14960 [Luteipulveratus halotolerans]
MSDRVVRRARATDRDAFVALRAVMFEAMDVPGWDDDEWQQAAGEWFERSWGSAEHCIVVAEVDGRVVATSVASLRDAVPSPGQPAGRRVLVHNVCTLPEARGQGHAQAAFAEMMRWVREESGAEGAELYATAAGRTMYERAGFRESTYPALRLGLTSHG